MDNTKDGEMRYQGRIASWNEARGFGFITPELRDAKQASDEYDLGRAHGVGFIPAEPSDSKPAAARSSAGAHGGGLLVHVTALQSDGRLPEPGERVTYLLGSGGDGKPRAIEVYFPDRPLTLVDIERPAARSVTSSAASSYSATARPPRPAAARERSYPSRRRRRHWRSMLIPLLVLAGLFSIYSRFFAGTTPPLPVSPVAQEEATPTFSTPQAATFTRQCDGRQHCSQMTSCEEATWFLQNCPGTKMDGEGDGIPCEDQWCVN